MADLTKFAPLSTSFQIFFLYFFFIYSGEDISHGFSKKFAHFDYCQLPQMMELIIGPFNFRPPRTKIKGGPKFKEVKVAFISLKEQNINARLKHEIMDRGAMLFQAPF